MGILLEYNLGLFIFNSLLNPMLFEGYSALIT